MEIALCFHNTAVAGEARVVDPQLELNNNVFLFCQINIVFVLSYNY